MTEDDLSIFRVRNWTGHGKLGGVRFLRFFDTSLRLRDKTEDDLSIFLVVLPPTKFRLAYLPPLFGGLG